MTAPTSFDYPGAPESRQESVRSKIIQEQDTLLGILTPWRSIYLHSIRSMYICVDMQVNPLARGSFHCLAMAYAMAYATEPTAMDIFDGGCCRRAADWGSSNTD